MANEKNRKEQKPIEEMTDYELNEVIGKAFLGMDDETFDKMTEYDKQHPGAMKDFIREQGKTHLKEKAEKNIKEGKDPLSQTDEMLLEMLKEMPMEGKFLVKFVSLMLEGIKVEKEETKKKLEENILLASNERKPKSFSEERAEFLNRFKVDPQELKQKQKELDEKNKSKEKDIKITKEDVDLSQMVDYTLDF